MSIPQPAVPSQPVQKKRRSRRRKRQIPIGIAEQRALMKRLKEIKDENEWTWKELGSQIGLSSGSFAGWQTEKQKKPMTIHSRNLIWFYLLRTKHYKQTNSQVPLLRTMQGQQTKPSFPFESTIAGISIADILNKKPLDYVISSSVDMTDKMNRLVELRGWDYRDVSQALGGLIVSETVGDWCCGRSKIRKGIQGLVEPVVDVLLERPKAAQQNQYGSTEEIEETECEEVIPMPSPVNAQPVLAVQVIEDDDDVIEDDDDEPIVRVPDDPIKTKTEPEPKILQPEATLDQKIDVVKHLADRYLDLVKHLADKL